MLIEFRKSMIAKLVFFLSVIVACNISIYATVPEVKNTDSTKSDIMYFVSEATNKPKNPDIKTDSISEEEYLTYYKLSRPKLPQHNYTKPGDSVVLDIVDKGQLVFHDFITPDINDYSHTPTDSLKMQWPQSDNDTIYYLAGMINEPDLYFILVLLWERSECWVVEKQTGNFIYSGRFL